MGALYKWGEGSMTDVPRTEAGAVDLEAAARIIHRNSRHGSARDTLAHLKSLHNAVVDDAAKACVDQENIFLSSSYATDQPLSSFPERMACAVCEEAIKDLKQ